MNRNDKIATIYNLKKRLGIHHLNEDDRIEVVVDDAIDHFKLLTGADEVEKKYHFIIRDVAAARYARKGSEGMSSESVDGYSANYIHADFEPYMDLLDRDFHLSKDTARKGRVMYW